MPTACTYPSDSLQQKICLWDLAFSGYSEKGVSDLSALLGPNVAKSSQALLALQPDHIVALADDFMANVSDSAGDTAMGYLPLDGSSSDKSLRFTPLVQAANAPARAHITAVLIARSHEAAGEFVHAVAAAVTSDAHPLLQARFFIFELDKALQPLRREAQADLCTSSAPTPQRDALVETLALASKINASLPQAQTLALKLAAQRLNGESNVPAPLTPWLHDELVRGMSELLKRYPQLVNTSSSAHAAENAHTPTP